MGTLLDAARFAQKEIQRKADSDRYYDDPTLWAEYMLGAYLWSKQRDICESVVENKSTAVKAGHGVSKSWTAGMLACWWIDTRTARHSDAFVVSTAPSLQQVGGVLWREIRNFQEIIENRYKEGLIDHVLPGTINTLNEWKDATGKPIGFGRKPPDNKEDSGMSGIHGHVLALGDEACHDEETEVLTERGWIPWPEATMDDRFLAWDTASGTTEYVAPFRLVSYDYRGEMVHYSNGETDFMVTPNHRMVYETAVLPGTFRREEAGQLTYSNKYMLRNIPSWSAESPREFVIPAHRGKRKNYPERRFAMADWAEFMGWVGSEGSMQPDGYCVTIWQTNRKYKSDIRSLLRRMGVSFIEGNDSFRIYGRDICDAAKSWGRLCLTKRVPDYIRNGSQSVIEAYLDAYVKGDGYRKSPKRRVIYTSSPQMASDLQELALKAGYGSVVSDRPPVTGVPMQDGRRITSHHTGYVISVTETNRKIRLRPEHVERVQYDGRVYCATLTKHNTLFTRRNGKTLWSGNCGLSAEMIDALSNITSNEGSRRLLIGNPTNPSSHFAKIFKEDTGAWNLISISVLDSPHFTDEKERTPQAVLDVLTGPQYVEDKKKEYGENSARYKARVLGEFAWDLGDTLISPEDVAIGVDTEIIPVSDTPVYLGVDVARFGKDKSVIYVNQGGKIRFHKSFDQNSLVELSGEVHRAALALGAHEVRYDVQGVGQGFEELLMQQEPRPYKMVGLAGSAASPDRRQWHNARAFWWDSFRKGLRQGLYDIDPEDDRLFDELVMVGYKFSNLGGLVIESKDAMRKRGMKSPDFADAAIYSAADVEEMLNPEPKKQTMLESPDQALDDMPAYLSLLVQGWSTM